MDNINNSYFDGHYKDIWKFIIPTELTIRETDFILKYFNLTKGCKVLDLMCGYGRHAISLAQNGIEVTAVDNLPAYIEEIRSLAIKENLSIQVDKADVITYTPNTTFDLAICMGNSISFFSKDEIIKLLSSVSKALKDKGQLLIHTWSLAEIAINDFREKTSSVINGLKYFAEASYLLHPTRIETETTIILPDGTTEKKLAIDYIFSVAEMEQILYQGGFILKEIYSIPGKKVFTPGEQRAYIIAEKR